MTIDSRIDIGELELHDLEAAFDRLGHPRFHARQVFQWVHKRGITDFAQMSDLGRDLRTQLGCGVRNPDAARRTARHLL